MVITYSFSSALSCSAATCILRKIPPILRSFTKLAPSILPYYRISLSSSPMLLRYLSKKNVGLLCGSSTHIHNSLSYTSKNIICDNMRRTNIDILYSKKSNINQYVVSNITDLKNIYAFSPNASFWIKTKISRDGISNAKKMMDYIWENKCLYNGIYYDVREFSNGHISASVYSHKIAMSYLCVNMFPYSHEIGLPISNIHINACDEISTLDNLNELRSIFKEYHIFNYLKTQGVQLHMSVDKLFDTQMSQQHNTSAYPYERIINE